MQLRAVTITGADDATPHGALAALSAEFPWVEWGVLLSARAWRAVAGTPQFPSQAWIARIRELADVRLSFHLCGPWAWDVTRGAFPSAIAHLAVAGSRVQLNVGAIRRRRDAHAIARCLPRGPEYIVQVGAGDGSAMAMARDLQKCGVDVSVLFDASGGRGLRPDAWPAPSDEVRCGFAGGLGPGTLEQDLARLSDVAGDRTIWIDMQAGARADDRATLDLTKVRRCLEIAARGGRVPMAGSR
jgi:hypothetical protein